MLTRWQYCLRAAMITRWHCYIDAIMITRWHHCIGVEMVTGWVHWIVNVLWCILATIAYINLEPLTHPKTIIPYNCHSCMEYTIVANYSTNKHTRWRYHWITIYVEFSKMTMPVPQRGAWPFSLFLLLFSNSDAHTFMKTYVWMTVQL